ncbi:MdtA/MuxA family multidrug efflux RND transporter periplasmic adaptor subunit [Celerinatantimonas yamalensis]|uniref:MdtA/MuxA family multidrug efflux RND transporter periplasmic adaptor subunit n=1 Tax=Celerinatantimonas yamalensis TaxID=559956 RepID=A0ABW9G8W3_9GAMM
MQRYPNNCSGKILFSALITLVITISIAATGYWYYSTHSSSAKTANASSNLAGNRSSMRKRHSFGNMTVPVYAGVTSSSDVSVYLHALGTVVANASVTVTSRATGALEKLYFTEGQYVKKGQLLASLDDRGFQATLAQYQGELAQNQALLKDAQLTLTRYQGLYREDSLSQQDLQEQTAKVGQYQGMVQSDKAQIDSARLNIDYTQIRAPISGYTGLRSVDPGNLVNSNDTELVTITQTQPIAVTFNIPQTNIPDVLHGLRHGQSFAVSVFNQTGSKELAQGKLKFMSNKIDSTTGTVKLKALFENSQQQLYPNQFVNVRLRIKQLHNVVVVPKAAVQLSDDGDFVFVIDKNNKVHRQVVTTGPIDGVDRIVITSGVKTGEQVVTTGVDNLSNGSVVSIIAADKAAQ